MHYPEKEFFVSCIACASGSAQINGMVRANLITVALPALKAERRDIIREPVHSKYIAVLHVIAIGIMPAEQEFIRSVTVQIQKRKRDFLQRGGGILPWPIWADNGMDKSVIVVGSGSVQQAAQRMVR